MRRLHRRSRGALATLIFAALPVAGASANVIYSDNFSSDTIGSQPSGWFLNTTTASTATDNVVSDANFISGTNPNGNAVNFNVTTSSSCSILTNFPSQSLAVGDSLSFSYEVLVATPSIPAYNRAFRFGIWNNNGTPVTTNGNPSLGTGDDVGYMDRLSVGTPSGTTFDTWQSNGAATNLLNAAPTSLAGSSTNTSYTLDDNNVHTLTITLTRTGAGTLTSTFTLDSLASITGTDNNAGSNAANFSFDEIALGLSGQGSSAGLDFHVGDVSVTYSPAVPEPAAASLVGLAVAGLLVKRRLLQGD